MNHLKKTMLPISMILAMILTLLIQPSQSESVTLAQSLAECTDVSDLGGTIFRDINNNGLNDTSEIGFSDVGITVYAYDSDNNVVGSTSVMADGSYVFDTIFDTYSEIRLEFVGLPQYLQTGFYGSDNGTENQIHTAGTCTANLGVQNPADYCESNPNLASTCFTQGNPLDDTGTAGDMDTLISFDYVSSGDGRPAGADPAQHDAMASDTGAVHGLAYSPETEQLFVSALVKRHSGIGSLGEAGIYIADYSTSTAPVLTPFADLNATLGIDFGQVGTGATPNDRNVSRGLTGNPTDGQRDLDAFAKVGKTGIGDIDMSEDGSSLFVMNLFDKTVYEVSTTAPVALLNSYPVPDPGCSGGEHRPFGLKYKDGVLYAGIVCDASAGTSADLDAHIVSLDHLNGATSFGGSLVTVDLDYERGGVLAGIASCDTNTTQVQWHPWTDATNPVLGACTPRTDLYVWPTPILSDIEFDDHGSMILGFMDRTGHQLGYRNALPENDSQIRLFSSGDILRVGIVNGTYTLENAGSVTTEGGTFTSVGVGSSSPGPITDNNAQGPGGVDGVNQGEFYSQDNYSNHNETSLGTLAVLPGSNEVITSVYDAVGTDINSGGFNWFNNSDGTARDPGYLVYIGEGNNSGLFGKSNGLGDIELLCELAPIQVGNYVWLDTNGDGVQDPDEVGIENVTVELWADPDGIPGNGDETLVTSAITGSDGEYSFNVDPDSNYYISVDPTQTALTDLIVTDDNYAGDGPHPTSNTSTDLHDSDGVTNAATGNVIIPFTSGSAGENDYTYDMGFYELGSITGNVSADTDGDMVPDINLENVVLELRDSNGNPVLDSAGNPITTMTDVNGDYTFTDVPPGDYQVVEQQPSGYNDQSEVDGGDDGDNPDNGIVNNIPVTVDSGETDSGNDFVEQQEPTAISLADKSVTSTPFALFAVVGLIMVSMMTWFTLRNRRQLR